MDVAYDSIQKEALVPEQDKEEKAEDQQKVEEVKKAGLNAEFQEAFKAVSASPWGAALGGLLGQVRKQVRTSVVKAGHITDLTRESHSTLKHKRRLQLDQSRPPSTLR